MLNLCKHMEVCVEAPQDELRPETVYLHSPVYVECLSDFIRDIQGRELWMWWRLVVNLHCGGRRLLKHLLGELEHRLPLTWKHTNTQTHTSLENWVRQTNVRRTMFIHQLSRKMFFSCLWLCWIFVSDAANQCLLFCLHEYDEVHCVALFSISMNL